MACSNGTDFQATGLLRLALRLHHGVGLDLTLRTLMTMINYKHIISSTVYTI
jgi:hypothetical protein